MYFFTGKLCPEYFSLFYPWKFIFFFWKTIKSGLVVTIDDETYVHRFSWPLDSKNTHLANESTFIYLLVRKIVFKKYHKLWKMKFSQNLMFKIQSLILLEKLAKSSISSKIFDFFFTDFCRTWTFKNAFLSKSSFFFSVAVPKYLFFC